MSEKRAQVPRHSSSKSVTFIPLSPQSSQTLRRHRLEHEQHAEQEAKREEEPPALSEEQLETLRPVLNRRRSSSDPSSSRPLAARRKRELDSPEPSDEVEVLPDRFDSEGRPLGSAGAMRWRQGAFETRLRHGNGWHSSGAWAVGGTDEDMVQRVAGDIENMISGQGSWKSLLKDVVGIVQEVQQGGQSRRIEDTDEEEDRHGRQRRRRRRRRSN